MFFTSFLNRSLWAMIPLSHPVISWPTSTCGSGSCHLPHPCFFGSQNHFFLEEKICCNALSPERSASSRNSFWEKSYPSMTSRSSNLCHVLSVKSPCSSQYSYNSHQRSSEINVFLM